MCPAPREAVIGIALSGRASGVVQVDGSGELVAPSTPIWSDTRGDAGTVFSRIDEEAWYLRTGNGFGAALYPVFKARTLGPKTRGVGAHAGAARVEGLDHTASDRRDRHRPFHGIRNRRLRPRDRCLRREVLDAAGLDASLFARPRESAEIVGTLSLDAAEALDCPGGVPVHAGAVDNAAMALGSRGTVTVAFTRPSARRAG